MVLLCPVALSIPLGRRLTRKLHAHAIGRFEELRAQGLTIAPTQSALFAHGARVMLEGRMERAGGREGQFMLFTSEREIAVAGKLAPMGSSIAIGDRVRLAGRLRHRDVIAGTPYREGSSGWAIHPPGQSDLIPAIRVRDLRPDPGIPSYTAATFAGIAVGIGVYWLMLVVLTMILLPFS